MLFNTKPRIGSGVCTGTLAHTEPARTHVLTQSHTNAHQSTVYGGVRDLNFEDDQKSLRRLAPLRLLMFSCLLTILGFSVPVRMMKASQY